MCIKFIFSYEQSQRVYGDLFSIIFVGIFALFGHATSVHFYHLIKSPVMGCMSCHVTLDVMSPFFNRK